MGKVSLLPPCGPLLCAPFTTRVPLGISEMYTWCLLSNKEWSEFSEFLPSFPTAVEHGVDRSSFDFFRDSHKGRTFLINFLSYFAPRHLNLIFVNCLFYLDVGFVNRYMESVFPESQEDSGKWNCFLDSVHSWCVYLLQIYLAK